MLKKLRIKFIAITMVSVVVVLTAIMVVVNVVNIANVNKDADALLDMLAENGGKMPSPPEGDEGKTPPEGKPESGEVTPPARPEGEKKEDPFGMGKRGIDAETPFDTRYFTVYYAEGEEPTADCGNVAVVDDESAVSMAENVLKKGKKRGYSGDYRYLVFGESGNETIIFVDYSRQLTPTRNFFKISMIVAAASVALVFIAVFFLSKKILRPVAQSYERQKRFVTDAGHELKTPLTVISANNDLIQMTTGEEESTGIIRKQVSKLTAMVNNLSALAKLDENASYTFQKIDLSFAIVENAEGVISLYDRDGKRMELDVEDDVVINGEPTLVDKLLGILLENAYKYSLTMTKVKLIKTGTNAVLTVTNDAEGVKKGKMNECFERFYRSTEARASKVEGSGIGLSVAKEIVELHKGKITAEGKEDGIFEIKVVF